MSAVLARLPDRLRSSLLLEQVFRRRSMRLRPLHVRLDALDLFLQRLDSFLKLINRKGIEILFLELGERILRLVREEIIEVHDA